MFSKNPQFKAISWRFREKNGHNNTKVRISRKLFGWGPVCVKLQFDLKGKHKRNVGFIEIWEDKGGHKSYIYVKLPQIYANPSFLAKDQRKSNYESSIQRHSDWITLQ
jgi:hypothetical protein